MSKAVIVKSVDAIEVDGITLPFVPTVASDRATLEQIRDAFKKWESDILAEAAAARAIAAGADAETTRKLLAVHDTHMQALADRDTEIAALRSDQEIARGNAAALKAAQADLVERASEAVVAGDMATLLVVLKDAQTPLQQRKLAEIAAKKSELLDQVAALDKQAEDVNAGNLSPAPIEEARATMQNPEEPAPAE